MGVGKCVRKRSLTFHSSYLCCTFVECQWTLCHTFCVLFTPTCFIRSHYYANRMSQPAMQRQQYGHPSECSRYADCKSHCLRLLFLVLLVLLLPPILLVLIVFSSTLIFSLITLIFLHVFFLIYFCVFCFFFSQF